MNKIRYIGPVLDHSGYGSAARNYVLLLHKAGVPITVEPHCFEPNPPPVGTSEERQILLNLMNKKDDFDIVVVHLTPDHLPMYKAKYNNKYIVSYTVWETSLLHPKWAKCCNLADEIWVPCGWNIESFINSGVNVPVHKIHHGIDPDMYEGVEVDKNLIPGIDKDNTFVFTSALQWNARKNPEGLLRTYFSTFKPEEPVRLLLKAYVGRGLSPEKEVECIRQAVKKIKADMQLQAYPKINLITENLSFEQMKSFYSYGDAYVSLTHGEGFGLTMLEAGLAGKPVIATGKGGNMEYMNSENSYPVEASWDYVYGMASFNPWYLGNQTWARPNLLEASKLMRYVYENRDEAAAKGRLLRDKIKSEFSWEAVSRQMVNRIEAISL